MSASIATSVEEQDLTAETIPIIAKDDNGLGFGIALLLIILITFSGFFGSMHKLGNLIPFMRSTPTAAVSKTNPAASTGADSQKSASGEDTPASQTTPSPPPPPGGQNLLVSGPYTGWKHYENTTYGFSFNFPGNWVLTEVPYDLPTVVDRTKMVIELTYKSTEKDNQTMTFKVNLTDLNHTWQLYHGAFMDLPAGSVTTSNATLSGREGVHFTDSSAGRKEIYLADGGSRTYVITSANESFNDGRMPDYWGDFDKVLQSLTVK